MQQLNYSKKMKVHREDDGYELRKQELYEIACQIKALKGKLETVKDWWFEGWEDFTAQEVAGIRN